MNPESHHHSMDREKKLDQMPSFDEAVDKLLNSADIDRLPEEEQGQVIVDRFIGSLVRRGGVEGSQISYSPGDVLSLMDKVSTEGRTALQEITRTDGLRSAVSELATDERVGKLFGQLGNRLEHSVDRQGREVPILTSIAQIEGYILGGENKNFVDANNAVGGVHMPGEDWVPVLLSEVERATDNENNHLPYNHELNDLIGSDLPLIKKSARDVKMAYSSAEKVGVDVDVVRRSVEVIKHRAKVGRHIGSTAVFLSSRRSIDRYREKERTYGIQF